MDLKLKDEITKLLIATPGMSISELAKKTKNYYSYTHKLVSNMERQGLVRVEKSSGSKEFTKCWVADDYKSEWINSLKTIIHSLKQDIEVKAALAILYIFALSSVLTPVVNERQSVLLASAVESSADFAVKSVSAPLPSLDWGLIVIILVPMFLLIWFIRKGSVYRRVHH